MNERRSKWVKGVKDKGGKLAMMIKIEKTGNGKAIAEEMLKTDGGSEMRPKTVSNPDEEIVGELSQ
jgi:hypothetical protein